MTSLSLTMRYVGLLKVLETIRSALPVLSGAEWAKLNDEFGADTVRFTILSQLILKSTCLISTWMKFLHY